METSDAHFDYGVVAVKTALADGAWRHLPWPAYARMAATLAARGELEAREHLGQTVYRLVQQA